MSGPARSVPYVLALAICGLASDAVAGTPEAAFQLLSDDEIAAHQARMETLSGAERQAYRDAEYANLRQRAADNGYMMPDTPPWTRDAALAASDPAPPPPAGAETDTATRHQQMRERLQSLLGGRDPAPAEDPDAAPAVKTVTAPAPSGDASAPVPTKAPEAGGTVPVAPPSAPAQAVQAPAAQDKAPAAPPASAGMAMPPTPAPAQGMRPAAPPAAIAPIAPIAPIPRPEPPRAPEAPARPEPPAPATAPPDRSERPPMGDYREQMRARFDDYLRQRQAVDGEGGNPPPTRPEPGRAVTPMPHPQATGPGYSRREYPPAGYVPPYPPR